VFLIHCSIPSTCRHLHDTKLDRIMICDPQSPAFTLDKQNTANLLERERMTPATGLTDDNSKEKIRKQTKMQRRQQQLHLASRLLPNFSLNEFLCVLLQIFAGEGKTGAGPLCLRENHHADRKFRCLPCRPLALSRTKSLCLSN
jgi:hypothetical protein